MKYNLNNKILEAVNRGIKFALDDFESDEEIQSQVNSKVKYQGGMKEYLDLMKDVVDLGLPSGTLWCKYNLGVDPNLLAKPEDWYGKYYAWGELEPKKSYMIDTYTLYDKENYSMTKYYYHDDLIELEPKDDVVYLNMHVGNYKFHIPTKEQCDELINNTTHEWVKDYSINGKKIKGLNGIVFTGKNDNKLFIPASGYYSSMSPIFQKIRGYIWTSSLYKDSKDDARNLLVDKQMASTDYARSRYNGIPVRPVINL